LKSWPQTVACRAPAASRAHCAGDHSAGLARSGERDSDAIEHRALGDRQGLGRNVSETRSDDVVDDVPGIFHDLPLEERRLTRLKVFEVKI
jgi:hypothetical protein